MKYILILVSILIVGGWFYWFQWKPAEIRKECNKEALEIATSSNIEYDNEIKLYKIGYEICKRSKGLK